MISERLRNREVYSDRPLKEAKWIIDELTKRLVLCIESMVRDGLCSQEEAEEMVLTSIERMELQFLALSDEELENYMRTEIAKADLAKALMKAGALK